MKEINLIARTTIVFLKPYYCWQLFSALLNRVTRNMQKETKADKIRFGFQERKLAGDALRQLNKISSTRLEPDKYSGAFLDLKRAFNYFSIKNLSVK